MSEPDALNEVIEQPITDDNGETVSETVSDTGENPDNKITFSDEQQSHIDKIIGDKAFKAREAGRKVKDLEAEIETLKSNAPQETRPEIPPIPDPYSDTYEDDVKARDTAINSAAKFDTVEATRTDSIKANETAKIKQAQESFNGRVDVYVDRSRKLGITDNELRTAGDKIAAYGINEQVADFIIDNESGPLITKFLSNNPAELERVVALSPMDAAIYIESSVKPKSVLKAKTTSTVEPTDTLSGMGVSTDNAPKGATFE